MKPLVAMKFMRDPILGVESFPSYLRRLANLYFVSLHQMLRYLSESEEVSALVKEKPFRLGLTTPAPLTGYVESVRKLARRVTVATGLSDVAATTLIRVGPSLTSNSSGAIVSKRRFCQRCAVKMIGIDSGVLWEPMIWSMATITRCPIHGQPLAEASHQWKGFDLIVRNHVATKSSPSSMPDLERWRYVETMRLIDYCSIAPDDFTPKDSPSMFIHEFLVRREMSMLDFSKHVGIGTAGIERKVHSEQGTSLKVVFNLAQKLAVSPVDILSNPVEAARQISLFELPKDMGTSLVTKRNLHPSKTSDLLRMDIRQLLASEKELTPFEMVCRARGVSPGFARHNMPNEFSSFMKRRWREIGQRNANRRYRAYAIAREALTDPDDPDASVSIKRTEKALRARSGLPKHLLLRALTETRRNLMPHH
jgi:hypothetical protein